MPCSRICVLLPPSLKFFFSIYILVDPPVRVCVVVYVSLLSYMGFVCFACWFVGGATRLWGEGEITLRTYMSPQIIYRLDHTLSRFFSLSLSLLCCGDDGLNTISLPLQKRVCILCCGGRKAVR